MIGIDANSISNCIDCIVIATFMLLLIALEGVKAGLVWTYMVWFYENEREREKYFVLGKDRK